MGEPRQEPRWMSYDLSFPWKAFPFLFFKGTMFKQHFEVKDICLWPLLFLPFCPTLHPSGLSMGSGCCDFLCATLSPWYSPLQWVRLQVLSENELHTLEAHCERNYQSFLVALPEGFGLCMSTYMWIFSIVNATVLCDLRFVVSMDLEFGVQRSYRYQG